MIGSVPSFRAATPLMTISDVARVRKVTARAIRFYEEEGLLSSGRNSQGFRLYDRQALDRLEFIVEARAIGVTVRELRTLARSGAIDDADLRRTALLEACNRCLDTLERKLALVEATIARQP